MQTLFLHPRDVDTTPAHLFWSAPPDEALLTSLTRFGQASPALVALAEGRPVLVAGSRRTLALREMRGRTLAAVAVDLAAVAAPEADVAAPQAAVAALPKAAVAALPQEAVASLPKAAAPEADVALPLPVRLGLAYLASNLGRPVTDAMAVAAGRYFTALGPVEDFLALAGPQLFAPADRRALLVARWLGLPAALDGLLASGHVPLGAAPLLAGCDPDTLAGLTPLLGAVRWSRANLDNALTWLAEAARIAGERPAALLARSGALDLPGRGLSPNDLAAGILASLRRIRYPATTTLEARFTALSRRLLAGSRVKIRPSQGFESDAVTVEVLVKSPAELSRAAADLAAMAAAPDLPKLLAVARDEDPA